jgi:hypothetical protein
MKPALGILCALILLPRAFAGIITEPFDGGAWIGGTQNQPLGQTFTADAPSLVSATFWLKNYSQVGNPLLTYSLLAGAGTNGPTLASSAISLPYGFIGSATANFDHVTLSIDQPYTLLIQATNIFWLVGIVQTDLPGSVDYTGGDAVISGEIDPTMDLGFQIVTVPEPGVGAMLVWGGCVAAMGRALHSKRRS